jgi:hypothetical protein
MMFRDCMAREGTDKLKRALAQAEPLRLGNNKLKAELAQQ